MKEVNDVYSTLKELKYGWLDKYGNIHEKLDSKLMRDTYILQTPYELIKNMTGLCLDQVEYEREQLQNFKSYFIIHNDGIKYYCHTFGVVTSDKYYWIENAWHDYPGIHEFETIEDIFEEVISLFPTINKLENVDIKDLYIFEYEKPKEHCSIDEFYQHCQNSKLVYHKEK